MVRPHVLSGGRYPVLRALAILYLILGIVTCIVGIAATIYSLVGFSFVTRMNLGIPDRIFIALGILVITFYIVMSMLAIAEVLKLAIDVEHNTRMNAAGRIGMAASVNPIPMPQSAMHDGGRLGMLDEETAEAALLRGH